MIEYKYRLDALDARPPLALTLGEPAGIGPDITFAAWRRRAELDLPPFYLLADPRSCRARAPSGSASTCRSRPSSPQRPPRAFAPRCRWSTRRAGDRRAGPPGSIERAGRDRRDPTAPSPTSIAGARRAIVTNPIAKNVLYRSGFADPGHTEYLAQARRASTTGVAAHAGDDAVVARARGRAGHHPSAAARRAAPADHAT